MKLPDVTPLSPFTRRQQFQGALLLVALVAVPGAPRRFLQGMRAARPPTGRAGEQGRRHAAPGRHVPRPRSC